MATWTTAGKSMMKIFFPVDVIPVVIPVAAASVLFGTMLYRIGVDPDTTRSGAHTEEKASDILHAQAYRNTFKGFFKERIAAGSIAIFPNKV